MSKSGKNAILNRNYLSTPTDDQTTLFCRPRDLMLHHCLFLCDYYMLLSAFVENAIQSSIANSIKAQTILGWYPDFSSCYAVYQIFEDQLFKRRFATQFPRHLLSLSALYPMCKLSGNQARMRERETAFALRAIGAAKAKLPRLQKRERTSALHNKLSLQQHYVMIFAILCSFKKMSEITPALFCFCQHYFNFEIREVARAAASFRSLAVRHTLGLFEWFIKNVLWTVVYL